MPTSAPQESVAQPHAVYRLPSAALFYGVVVTLAFDIFWIAVLVHNPPTWTGSLVLLIFLWATVMMIASVRTRVAVAGTTVVVRRRFTTRRFERGRSTVSFYEHPYAKRWRRWAFSGTLRFTDTERDSSINFAPAMLRFKRRQQMFHDVEAALNVPIIRLPHRNFWPRQ